MHRLECDGWARVHAHALHLSRTCQNYCIRYSGYERSQIPCPSPGVGGYCLTKDPLLASWAKQNLINSMNPLQMSESAVKINDKMPEFAFNFLESFFENGIENLNVCLLGVSYLSDVGDTRYTPVELLYKCLNNAGCKMELHDPYVSFWEELNIPVNNDISILDKDYDILIFSTGHTVYKSNSALIKAIMKKDKVFILDTIGILSADEILELSSKHTVKVIGRGDI